MFDIAAPYTPRPAGEYDRPGWKTTPPTKPGHYWTWGIHAAQVYLMELSEKYGGLSEAMSGLSIDELSGCTHWLGPLPVPESPLAPASECSEDENTIAALCFANARLADELQNVTGAHQTERAWMIRAFNVLKGLSDAHVISDAEPLLKAAPDWLHKGQA